MSANPPVESWLYAQLCSAFPDVLLVDMQRDTQVLRSAAQFARALCNRQAEYNVDYTVQVVNSIKLLVAMLDPLRIEQMERGYGEFVMHSPLLVTPTDTDDERYTVLMQAWTAYIEELKSSAWDGLDVTVCMGLHDIGALATGDGYFTCAYSGDNHDEMARHILGPCLCTMPPTPQSVFLSIMFSIGVRVSITYACTIK